MPFIVLDTAQTLPPSVTKTTMKSTQTLLTQPNTTSKYTNLMLNNKNVMPLKPNRKINKKLIHKLATIIQTIHFLKTASGL